MDPKEVSSSGRTSYNGANSGIHERTCFHTDFAGFYRASLARVKTFCRKRKSFIATTDYQASLTLLRESGQASGRAYYWMGRDHFMLGDYKKAAERFERAFTLEPGNSEYAHWLGRSFGRRAETSSPFFAPTYASKARAYFEKAVALDPGNEEALSDLFDYYLEAPGFLRRRLRQGGSDRATHRPAESGRRPLRASAIGGPATAVRYRRRTASTGHRFSAARKWAACWIWRGISPGRDGSQKVKQPSTKPSDWRRTRPESGSLARGCTSNRSATWIKPRLC